MPKRRGKLTPSRYGLGASQQVPTEERVRRDAIRDALLDIESVVYFVPVDGLVKIGYTTRLRNRLSCYGLAMTDVLLLLPGGRAEESGLHLLFAKHLARGREYFRQAPEIVDFIEEHRARLGVGPAPWPVRTAEQAVLTAWAEAAAGRDAFSF